MSVRRRNWCDPKTGERKHVWMVDIKFQHPDGRVQRVRKVSPVPTRRGAEQYEREMRQALLAGSFGTQEEQKPTFKAFAEEFVTTYAEPNNKPSEVMSKKSILKQHLLPAFGHLTLDAIGARQIEAYKSAKLKGTRTKRGLNPKTINNHLTVLQKILGTAVDWGLIAHHPKVKWLRAAEPDFKFLTFDEADALIEASDPNWRAMIFTALRTGLRLGELRALRWCDVDLKTSKLMVRRSTTRGHMGTPKGGRSREVPLTTKVVRVLQGHRHLRGELVFCREDGGLLSKGETRWPLWRACDAAEVQRIGWHTLRHTLASHLVMLGVGPNKVQEILGHSDIRMTMRYTHLTPDTKQEAVELLEQSRGTIGAHDVPIEVTG